MAYIETTVLGIVKGRLNRLPSEPSPLDDYLRARIEAADIELAGDGIHLIADNVRDQVFLADIVVWQYGNRDKQAGMPEWLRLARRERWLKERSVVADDTG